MPLEIGVWRIDDGLKTVEFGPLNLEARLEDILDSDISIASPDWLVIGRQVQTNHGGRIDLLAMDRDGNLIVIELKRDQTYRDIVAQVLDYGSWVSHLQDDHVAQVFDDYQKRWKDTPPLSLDQAFKDRFGISLPDEINSSHELVIVASRLDPGTERVVRYLADEYSIRINAVFFRVFRDDGREYLSRAWFRDPTDFGGGDDTRRGEWNGEYYVSFGYDLDIVRDGLERGYIVAGGGSWYSRTLAMLEPGARIWVNVPSVGYVGVGCVEEGMQPIEGFTVRDSSGNEVRLIDVSSVAAALQRAVADPEKGEYIVRVQWIKTVQPRNAIRERGFFGNQNSVARPRTSKWDHTVERLKIRFGVSG